MSNDFDKYLAIANHDIQMANNIGELKSYVASILYDNDKKIDMIHELEEEIKEYQKALDETTSEKIELANIIKEVREYINDNVMVYAFNDKKFPHWDFNDDNINDILEILDKGSDEISK